MIRAAGIAHPDAPGPAIRLGAQSPQFAEIQQDVFDASGAQQLGHPVGHVSLGDAVQRYRHARLAEPDAPGSDVDPVIIDQRQCGLKFRTRRYGARRLMRRQQPPERLDRHVEPPAAEVAETHRFGQQPAHVQAGIWKNAVAVQPAQGRVWAEKAELAFQPIDLGKAGPDDRPRLSFDRDGRV